MQDFLLNFFILLTIYVILTQPNLDKKKSELRIINN